MHPRPYLSYTQMVMVEKQPDTYRQVYFEGKQLRTNRGQALGKEIAEAVEHDEETGDITKDVVIAQLPKYELRDQKIEMTLKIGKAEVPLLIRPDSCKSDYSALLEYKTGVTMWNQFKVDKDDQTLFYVTALRVLTRKIAEAALIWAPTKLVIGEDGIGRPELTGDIYTFERKVTYQEILRMQGRMIKAWATIGAMVEKEIV